MKVLYESLDLWSIVDKGISQPVNPFAQQENDLKELERKDKKALFLIYQSVDDPIFERISGSKSSKEAWDALHNTYRGQDRVKVVRLQTLRCEFDGLRMKESETIEEFYNRVISLINQMRLNGEDIEEKRVVQKILRSLIRKFEYVVVAVEESKDLSVLSLENLLGILQSHEFRMRNFDDDSTEKAFQVSSKLKGKEHAKPLAEIQCFYCHKFGHIMKYCKKRKEDESEDVNFICGNEFKKDDTMFMAIEELESFFDNGWCKDGVCDDLVKENKKLCKLHGKLKEIDDDDNDA